ncbi:Colicin V production protein [Alicyclobacillus hesperidum URH17-3-68]|uniref:CvpA family protein n=1 Tax=Alicyclobacillus hesperidum TaxID=89784 RepID=UPI000281AD79|nr:CvpA family protein [Alicyclobacillus hesperidum]EJY56295.1 Colicin V production protein [Alicyclobacillus hesperidum URH17-3-68]
MNGDVLDLIFAAIIVLGAINGYRLGLIRQVTRLFGAIIAYFVSYWLRPYVAPVIAHLHIGTQVQEKGGIASLLFSNLSGAIAFGLVFILTFLLLRYAAGLLDALFSLPVLSFVNRLAGLIAGVALAIIFVYVIGLILHYVNTPSIQHQVNHSAIVHWLNSPSFNQAVSRLGKGKAHAMGTQSL